MSEQLQTQSSRRASALPPQAWAVLGFVWLAAVVAACLSVRAPRPHAATSPAEWGLFLVLSILASRKRVAFLPHQTKEGAGSISLGTVAAFAALFRLGLAGGVLVGAAGTLAGCLLPRQRWYQIGFNVAVDVLAMALSGAVFAPLNGAGWMTLPAGSLPALGAAAAAYFAVNTGLVATVIGASTGRRPFPLWREQFLWLAPGDMAAVCVGALTAYLFGHRGGGFVLLAVPLAYPLYQSYALHVTRSQEKQQHSESLAELYLSTIKTLALAVDAKDPYTHQHIVRVQRYAVAIAEQMGLEGDEMVGLNTGALLHDIGKIGIPDAVLLKPGRLTDEEFALIKQHPTIGAQILGPVEFPWPVLPVVKSHHERWDGAGYPDRLKGEAIPLTARVLAVADVYDALTSQRSYRDAWSHERAVDEIRRCAGTHFDPAVVTAFLDVVDVVRAEIGEVDQDTLPTAELRRAA